MHAQTSKDNRKKMDLSAEELTVAVQHEDDNLKRLTARVAELNQAIAQLKETNQKEDIIRPLNYYQDHVESNNFSDLPAEDASDFLIRLQKQVEAARKRNEQLAHEKQAHERALESQARKLACVSKNAEYLTQLTGWTNDKPLHVPPSAQEAAAMRSEMTEMAKEEAVIQHEMRATQNIICRKQQTIVSTQALIAAAAEKSNIINEINNQVRQRQRECQELKTSLERMRAEDIPIANALQRIEASNAVATNSIAVMESDRNMLLQASKELKKSCRDQDTVIRGLFTRQDQLQKILSAVQQSLREMNLEAEYSRESGGRALVPAADDTPPSESTIQSVSVEVYRLLHKNNEMMRALVARKNMLVLEKESVIQAIQAKLNGYIGAFNATANQDENVQLSKSIEMGELLEDLQSQHQMYRDTIRELTKENQQLRGQMSDFIQKRNRHVKAHPGQILSS